MTPSECLPSWCICFFLQEWQSSPFQTSSTQCTITDVEFAVSDAESQLKSLKPDSAMGPDNLYLMLLKRYFSPIAYPFYVVFKKSLSSGSVPNLWKHSHVTPIYKKRSRTDPLSYWPISLTPIPCKLLWRITSKSLNSFLSEHLLLDDIQYGFHSCQSVSNQLLLTYNKVTQWYDQGYTVDLILFNFVKAFNRVHHQTLLDKLSLLGITGNLLQWIKSRVEKNQGFFKKNKNHGLN